MVWTGSFVRRDHVVEVEQRISSQAMMHVPLGFGPFLTLFCPVFGGRGIEG
jgi:hypothetical protein